MAFTFNKIKVCKLFLQLCFFTISGKLLLLYTAALLRWHSQRKSDIGFVRTMNGRIFCHTLRNKECCAARSPCCSSALLYLRQTERLVSCNGSNLISCRLNPGIRPGSMMANSSANVVMKAIICCMSSNVNIRAPTFARPPHFS